MLQVLVVLVALLSPAVWADARPFGWSDLFSMVRLSDLAVSPDGSWLLFTRTEPDIEGNKSRGNLAMISADGKKERVLTRHEAPDTNGRWLPDGSGVLFLSSRSGSSQMWKISVSGGEAEQATDLPVDMDGFEVSPDGLKILFWASVFPDCPDLACTASRLKEREKNPIKARLFDKIFVRHWDGWKDGRRNHPFVMDLASGAHRDLLSGVDQDAPTSPWGGSDEVAWSPDSLRVAFVSKPSEGEAWRTGTGIYLSDLEGKRELLTGDNAALDTGPAFSPDGTRLAFRSMERPDYESDRLHIRIIDLSTRAKRSLTKAWDRSVDEMVWARDGTALYVTAVEHARKKIFRVDATSGSVRPLVEEGVTRSLRIGPDGRLFFLNERMTRPAEVFVYDPAASALAPVSNVNRQRLSAVRMSEPEGFWFEHDGRKMHGWFLKPVNFRSGRSYPLAVLIHGGPQGSWTDGFHYRWNPQVYAGAGYAVLAIDPRGSTGYGQALTDSIRGDWGVGPYSDIMAGLEGALSERSYVDRRRMCALGASYGGYMVNWIAGEKHPFSCLINHSGLFDTTSFYFNTEELWFLEWEMTGPPWKARDVYERNSPMLRVDRWNTPMLVIHGAKDFRVAETEGFSTFNALQRRGIPSRLLYFPDESHWVRKPLNSKLWHETVLAWMDRWTKTKR